jgi:hypothetical protein
MNVAPQNGSCPRASRTKAARLSAPRRKSTGFVATRIFTPAAAAIMSPPLWLVAPQPKSRHRFSAQPELSQLQSRSQSMALRHSMLRQHRRPQEQKRDPRHHPRPDAVHSGATRIIAAASIRAAALPRKPFPAGIAFRNNSALLLDTPRATAASSGENLKPPHRLRLGLGQKLTGHASNQNRTSIRLDNCRSLLGLEGGERRSLDDQRPPDVHNWPSRTKDRRKPSGPLGISGLPAEQIAALPSKQQRSGCLLSASPERSSCWPSKSQAFQN